MKRNYFACAALALAVTNSVAATAEVAVIVHPSVAVSGDKGQIADLFLGKTAALGGQALTPVDQDEGLPARTEFYEKVAGRTAAQLNAYWSRLVFTGKGQPPKMIGNDLLVKEAVAKNPGMIGYVDASVVDASVKTVLVLP